MRNKLTLQQKMLRQVKESDWQKTVERIARFNGWMVYHAPDNKPDSRGRVQNITAGFPDLVLVKNGTLIFAELKSETGKTSVEQNNWLTAISACKVLTFVWRPSNIDEVRSFLER